MMIRPTTKVERFRVVLGLSAAGLTYEAMTRFVGVGSRQRVQQLVVDAMAALPQLAQRLGVTGRRHLGRRPGDGHAADVHDAETTEKRSAPRTSTRVRHIASARQLLEQHGGRYPSATEMLSSGHGALYQYMRKYPNDFERLARQHRVALRRSPHRRRRRY